MVAEPALIDTEPIDAVINIISTVSVVPLVDAALIVSVPVISDDVYVTVAIPLLFVIAVASESVPVPAVTENDIVSPPTGLSFASITTAWIVLVLAPSAVRLFGVAARFIVSTAPGVKCTDVESLTPPTVAVMVAVPRLVGLVNMAVATPFVVVAVVMVGVVSASKLPAVVVNVTSIPSGTSLPLISLIIALIRVFEMPSATILSEPVLSDTDPTETCEAASIVIVVLPSKSGP